MFNNIDCRDSFDVSNFDLDHWDINLGHWFTTNTDYNAIAAGSERKINNMYVIIFSRCLKHLSRNYWILITVEMYHLKYNPRQSEMYTKLLYFNVTFYEGPCKRMVCLSQWENVERSLDIQTREIPRRSWQLTASRTWTQKKVI